MRDAVLQSALPDAPWEDPVAWRLPGTRPIAEKDWLIRDDAFDGQMRLRDRFLRETPEKVLAIAAEAHPAALECLDLVIDALAHDPGYRMDAASVTRSDGVSVPLDRSEPLATVGRLIQADVCLLGPSPSGHVLTGAVLCFPAHWTLAEKIGRPMPGIHGPVDSYDETMARRVQRLFDGLSSGRVLTRSNAFLYRDAHLFAPRAEAAPRAEYPAHEARFIRSERQTLRKLPVTEAIVFTIHTIVVPLSGLTPNQRATLETSGIRRS